MIQPSGEDAWPLPAALHGEHHQAVLVVASYHKEFDRFPRFWRNLPPKSGIPDCGESQDQLQGNLGIYKGRMLQNTLCYPGFEEGMCIVGQGRLDRVEVCK